jgi:alpha-tubulin suppressor-like RCC1 family protein
MVFAFLLAGWTSLGVCAGQPGTGGFKPVQNWTVSLYSKAGDGANTPKHFLRRGDGTVVVFAPGQPPQPFAGLDHVVALAASTFHALALKDDGTVWAWGKNDEGELGSASLIRRQSERYTSYYDSDPTPVQVTGVRHAVAITTSERASYALLDDGTVMAWGEAAHYGPYGVSRWRLPMRLAGVADAVAISGDMALLRDGRVLAWGGGWKGRLGNGGTDTSFTPVSVRGIHDAVAIAASEDGGLALLRDGTIMGWGRENNGETASKSDTTEYSTVPVRVARIPAAVAISAWSGTNFVLLRDHTVVGWGDARLGALASKAGGPRHPGKLVALHDVVGIQSGIFNGMAVLADGTVMGWGSGMTTRGPYYETHVPVKVAVLGANAPH